MALNKYYFRDSWQSGSLLKKQFTNCGFCGKLFPYKKGKVFIQCPHCGGMNKR